ncbi:zinc metalloproteinase nas-15-like [Paramacrobiotus metropolitanus]|uniref:zinc metalloproteinase nas-15-like n=1 Tax=Paramacrobiotus metropolitanus TaxID=2943436 RepID=UPI0024458EBA|nr:zinc metalloproteinase nas-15-like [Paramacrobiotus metropolitanus]
MIGRQGGRQYVYYTPGCLRRLGQIIHEVMHSLGFYHEMSRVDRDDYVTIVCSNIGRRDWKQFVSYRGDLQGLPYDYDSLMHYPFNAFGKDLQLPTIIPKKKGARIGQRDRMSALDVVRIKLGYKCPLTASEKKLVKKQPADQSWEPSSCKTAGQRA